ncbi:hypothetical protein NC652_006563 [Populus alba x Populus x berolinensis]|nr:hypothetical protein NC652_006563 [Populus alba x Populus x berolinensis]
MGLRFEKLRAAVERVWRWNPWLRQSGGFPLIFVIWVLLKSSLLGVHAVELPYDGPETIVMSEWMVPQEESESSDSDHGKSYKRIKASSLSSFTALSCTMR